LCDTGGYGVIPVGFTPNTRTVMQIVVSGSPATADAPYDLAALQEAFTPTNPAVDGVFKKGQNPILVGQPAYNAAYDTLFDLVKPYWGFSNIFSTELNFKTVAGDSITIPMQPKAIQDEMGEVFDPEYGRMMGAMGVELPLTNAQNQNFVLQGYIDKPTEIIDMEMEALSPVAADGTQIWKITHNGVDTHPVHFHEFDAQLINRVGWDGFITLPDPTELGWKDTIRVSPLEDTIVAVRANMPKIPFGVPDSIRPLNPSAPIGSTEGFSPTDPYTGLPLATPVTNELYNFKWEYVWHCHILSHEEMDMMRPIQINVSTLLPGTPVLQAGGTAGGTISLRWTDPTPAAAPSTLGNLSNEIGFRIMRRPVNDAGVVIGPWAQIGTALANATTYTDSTTTVAKKYRYRVVA